MARIADEPAIVLHARAYRESSLIINLMTLHHGRVNLVARGVRGGRRGRSLMPFSILSVGWSGRTSLGTMTAFELEQQHWFKGNALASAFYLTELTSRLVTERESHPRLFAGLKWAFSHVEEDLEWVLRRFEKLLLEDLGYGLDFSRDVNGKPIEAGMMYAVDPERGFTPARTGYSGAVLGRIDREEFTDPEARQAAKHIFRLALSRLLGPAPLMSRRLLVGNPR